MAHDLNAMQQRIAESSIRENPLGDLVSLYPIPEGSGISRRVLR